MADMDEVSPILTMAVNTNYEEGALIITHREYVQNTRERFSYRVLDRLSEEHAEGKQTPGCIPELPEKLAEEGLLGAQGGYRVSTVPCIGYTLRHLSCAQDLSAGALHIFKDDVHRIALRFLRVLAKGGEITIRRLATQEKMIGACSMTDRHLPRPRPRPPQLHLDQGPQRTR